MQGDDNLLLAISPDDRYEWQKHQRRGERALFPEKLSESTGMVGLPSAETRLHGEEDYPTAGDVIFKQNLVGDQQHKNNRIIQESIIKTTSTHY